MICYKDYLKYFKFVGANLQNHPNICSFTNNNFSFSILSRVSLNTTGYFNLANLIEALTAIILWPEPSDGMLCSRWHGHLLGRTLDYIVENALILLIFFNSCSSACSKQLFLVRFMNCFTVVTTGVVKNALRPWVALYSPESHKPVSTLPR